MSSSERRFDDEAKIKAVLEEIQKGYSKIDLSKVESWILTLFDKNVTVIGTNEVIV